MKVRQLIEADLDQTLGLYSELAGPWPLPEGELAEVRWNEIITHPGTFVFGVELQNRLIAIATLHILPNMTFSAHPYALAENVVVSLQHRRSGVGKRLMQHVIDFAKENNCYKIMLLTGKANGAKSFYESVGYNEEEKFGMTIRFAPKRFGNRVET